MPKDFGFGFLSFYVCGLPDKISAAERFAASVREAQERHVLSSTTEFGEQQLAAARLKTWHQDGEAILTLEAARAWLGEMGLVLFAPRSQQLATPAASFVEATVGAATANPTAAAIETARGLVARMVAEGSALPLNLMGTQSDLPDFVVSSQVFSYVFTLRGDKAWKQPPSTSGAVKVSTLSLRVFEALTAKGAQTAAELANELGREVTEAAILRALSELWSQLRVIPMVQAGTASTLWELATQRFTKTIKAGANAGQPTALSALVSLYLAQAIASTEDEIETYLSPLTARSRVREVLHALTGARQLDTVVVEGKTLLHLPGSLPEAVAEPPVIGEDGVEVPAAVEAPKKIGTGRINKFVSETKAVGELRGKPVGKPAKKFAEKRGVAGGLKPTPRFAARLDGKTDAERRPFKKAGAAKPAFDKPWDEDKKPRAAKPAAPDAFTKYRKPAPEDREPLAPREQAGLPPEKRTAPKTSFDRAPKTDGFVKRPYKPREGGTRPFVKKSFADRGEGGDRPYAKKPSTPRTEGGDRAYAKKPYASRGAEGGARSFSKPRFGDKPGAKPGGFGAKRPYTPRTEEGGDRPAFAKRPYTPRGEAGGERSFSKPRFGDKPGGFGKKPFAPRSAEGGFAKRPYTPRTTEGGDRPAFAKRPYTPREEGGGERPYPKRPFTPRSDEGGERSFSKPRFGGKPGGRPGGFGSRPRFEKVDENAPRMFEKKPYKPRAADADQRKFTNDPWVPGPDDRPAKKRSFKDRGEGAPRKFASKPFGKSGPKKFGSKPGGFAGKKPAPRKPAAEE